MRTIRGSRSVAWCVAVGAALASPVDVLAREACTSDDQCAPWATCSTSVGDCESDDSNSDVCWGRCVEGQRWRLSPRLGGVLTTVATTNTSGAVGLEVTPPVVGGRVALATDIWTNRLIRLGAAASLLTVAGVRFGARVDATTYARSLGAMVSARVEFSPVWLIRDVTPLHVVSLQLEAGAWLPGRASDPSPFAGLGLNLWW